MREGSGLIPNSHCSRVLVAVADGNEDFGVSKVAFDRIGKMDDGFAEGIVEDLDFVPLHLGAKACPKRLHNGFFGGEPAGKMRNGILVLITVILFLLRKEAVEEVQAVPFNAFG